MSDQQSAGPNQIHQKTQGDRTQTIGQVYGGIVVYGNVTLSAAAIAPSPDEAPPSVGANPYKGLLAFREADSEQFFGRSREIDRLWNGFSKLYEADHAIRLLPIYGPSGSGKSSLARAGLVSEIGRRLLPGRDRARVAVMEPGTQPLQKLATILARIADNDLTPVAKAREFAEELSIPNKAGKFDGLQRIANVLPDIATFPLIVLVDQLEEIYSLCDSVEERNQLIENLLYAASDRSKYVSVIVTFRSDFLGETHRHLALNQLFSAQGFLVPMMDEDALQEAITQPAKNAGQTLDIATVNWLIQETQGREGTLPALQVALETIWNHLPQEPAQTLSEIGGVGGALVNKADELYEGLSQEQQAIAQRVFLGLVQLGDGPRDTRRRVDISTLIAAQETPALVQAVINKFASPHARLIMLSSDGQTETAEVTHEALLDRWPRLRRWRDDSRNDLRFQRHLEGAAQYWQQQGRPVGLLWRSPDLDLLQEFVRKSENDLHDHVHLTALQLEFFKASEQQKNAETLAEQRRIDAEKMRIEAENERIKAEDKRLEAEKKLTRRVRYFLLSLSGLMGVIALGSWLFSGKLAHQQKVIESVFLGASTRELIESLPELEASAVRLQKAIDTLPVGVDGERAIAHYTQHEEDFKKLFAYYRNILETTGKLKLENLQYDPQQVERIERQLADVIIKYRIPQLQVDFTNQTFSQYMDKPVTAFENQYTNGHIKTTYEMLMTHSGVGADLNKDGFVGDTLEANLMPCELLKKLEEVWRHATQNACGWYNLEGQYAVDSDCKQLDEDRSTLYTAIFSHDMGLAMDRIKFCAIPPQ